MEVIGVVADTAPSSGMGVRYGAFGGGGVTAMVVEVLLGVGRFDVDRSAEMTMFNTDMTTVKAFNKNGDIYVIAQHELWREFRYWSNGNSQEIHEKPLHSLKVTVSCMVLSFAIIGPYFFEDAKGETVTVIGEHYVHMLENLLAPYLLIFCEKRHFLKQDDTMSHTAGESMRAVRNLLANHLIFRYGDIGWPAISPDM